MATNKLEWVEVCSSVGPFKSDLGDIVCMRPKGHNRMGDIVIDAINTMHSWYSDDGSVKVEWMEDWNTGQGAWREEHAD